MCPHRNLGKTINCYALQIFEESWREEKVIEIANKLEFEEKGIQVNQESNKKNMLLAFI